MAIDESLDEGYAISLPPFQGLEKVIILASRILVVEHERLHISRFVGVDFLEPTMAISRLFAVLG